MFAVVAASSVLLGAGLAMNNDASPLCAKIASGTVAIVESRNLDSIVVRVPVDSTGYVHSCTGEAR